MKKLYKAIIILIAFFTIQNFASDKKVLVEIFTNSHCPLCPPAHSAIDSYLQNGNGDKIEFIYYHMVFPYPTDQLYQDNMTDAAEKNNLYGSYSSTPQAFFNGSHVGNSYNSWASTLDGLANEANSFDISLSGSFSTSDFKINAEIKKNTETSDNDLVINFVVVENVQYQGNNGISNHKNVMRKIANINGDPFSLNVNESISKSTTFTFNELWNSNNLKIIAYIQSSSSKKVYQSESISYTELTITDVEQTNNLPNSFYLYQNYPNPFNPTTTIEYSLPKLNNNNNSNVSLVIFNAIGKEIKTLVNKTQSAGNYSVTFNASDLSSGLYFYQLTFGEFSQIKKMILLK